MKKSINTCNIHKGYYSNKMLKNNQMTQPELSYNVLNEQHFFIEYLLFRS